METTLQHNESYSSVVVEVCTQPATSILSQMQTTIWKKKTEQKQIDMNFGGMKSPVQELVPDIPWLGKK